MNDIKFDCYKSDSIQSFDSLQNLDKDLFPHHIGKADSRLLATFSILLDPENLFFSVKYSDSSNYDKLLAKGMFKSDLWKQDVVELFIAADQGSEYQEFNIAPSGAYWTAKFSDYRLKIPESDLPNSNLQIETRSTLSGRILSMKIPRSQVIPGCTFGNNSRFNCCAIFGKEPRNYFSTSILVEDKPDFHDLSKWGASQFQPIA